MQHSKCAIALNDRCYLQHFFDGTEQRGVEPPSRLIHFVRARNRPRANRGAIETFTRLWRRISTQRGSPLIPVIIGSGTIAKLGFNALTHRNEVRLLIRGFLVSTSPVFRSNILK